MTHTVKEGETLSGIAERYQVSISDLKAWNRLDPKKPIQPGMRLTIMGREPAAGNAGP
jgi:membrane-bound lytic murein transglycosylase D